MEFCGLLKTCESTLICEGAKTFTFCPLGLAVVNPGSEKTRLVEFPGVEPKVSETCPSKTLFVVAAAPLEYSRTATPFEMDETEEVLNKLPGVKADPIEKLLITVLPAPANAVKLNSTVFAETKLSAGSAFRKTLLVSVAPTFPVGFSIEKKKPALQIDVHTQNASVDKSSVFIFIS